LTFWVDPEDNHVGLTAVEFLSRLPVAVAARTILGALVLFLGAIAHATSGVHNALWRALRAARRFGRKQAGIDSGSARILEDLALGGDLRSAAQCEPIIGVGVVLGRALAVVAKAACTDTSILITGETGSEKELAARVIHALSPRRTGPFISVNCSAIPTGLADSELFGYEPQALTDTQAARPGRLELAAGGTLFLDEVTALPFDIQAKLVRVLKDREVRRVGGHAVHKLNLRVVSSTTCDLHREMNAGRFRSDLFYRLAVVVIDLPPLRDRIEDLAPLATAFLRRAASAHHKSITALTPDALAALSRYNWPGNVRELQHVVERAVLLCTSDVIMAAHLCDLAISVPADVPHQPLVATLREEKSRRIEQALAQTGGDHAAAARLLGISPSSLARLIRSLGLKPPPSLQ